MDKLRNFMEKYQDFFNFNNDIEGDVIVELIDDWLLDDEVIPDKFEYVVQLCFTGSCTNFPCIWCKKGDLENIDKYPIYYLDFEYEKSTNYHTNFRSHITKICKSILENGKKSEYFDDYFDEEYTDDYIIQIVKEMLNDLNDFSLEYIDMGDMNISEYSEDEISLEYIGDMNIKDDSYEEK
ncbi:MAG: hypothetical protein CMF62_03625 [Magnetococcales bacterium]|nr:hypothetical protein [Magnetococcales bacterium]|tara:strand:- start:24886 stop:25428 length:543 start_codon:yes stop_codon:yes gene_type:complete